MVIPKGMTTSAFSDYDSNADIDVQYNTSLGDNTSDQSMDTGMRVEFNDPSLRTRDAKTNTLLPSQVMETVSNRFAAEEEEDERVFVLEELRDRLESVDNAKDLGAIGGLTPLLEGIQSEKWEEIRAMSAECVAVSVQNHPEAQKNAMSCDALRVLLLALQSEKHLNKKSNAKVIYALSCLVRGNQEVMGMFVKSDGIESLAKSGLASSVIKTRVKAATLLRHASVSSEEAMKRTIDAKVIDIIAEKLGANVNSQNASSSSLTDLAQEREAYIRLLLDVAQRVDFMKNEDAVNQFRSERFVQTVQNCQTFVDASKKNRDKMIDEEEFIVAVDRLRNMLK